MKHSPAYATRVLLSLTVAAGLIQITSAQDRLRTMPGYERYQEISTESRDAVKTGALTVTWTQPAA